MTTLTLTGHADPQQTKTYAHVPFDVPDGIGRIDVRYQYSDLVGSDPHLTNGNTVDIGIFDPRGIQFLTDGFRGWSGSARQEFFISGSEATPGYLAGTIQPGTWNICLGLYKIAPQGCDYQVEITLTPGDSAVTLAPLLPLRTTPGRVKPDGWYCGELHNHTYHSDGDSDPLDVVRRAESLGLDFLAITDHNSISHLARLNTIDTPLMLIPGIEVTTFKGHWNVWGDQGWIDFRIEDEAHMAQAVAEAVRRGYLTSINHPRPYGPEWEYPAVDGVHCIEVWNGPWPLMNEIALEFWEARLRAGKRYTAVGGSDNHFLKQAHVAHLGEPTVWLHCTGAPSVTKLLDAIRAGRVMISESPHGPRVTLNSGQAMMGDCLSRSGDYPLIVTGNVKAGAGCTLQLYTEVGCIEQQFVPTESFQFFAEIAADLYVRAQLIGDTGQVRALTNPIYVR